MLFPKEGKKTNPTYLQLYSVSNNSKKKMPASIIIT